MAKVSKEKVSPKEILWMAVISVLIPAVVLIASLIYVAFYAGGFSLFQKIVVVVVGFVIIGLLEALVWLVWAGRKGIVLWKQNR